MKSFLPRTSARNCPRMLMKVADNVLDIPSFFIWEFSLHWPLYLPILGNLPQYDSLERFASSLSFMTMNSVLIPQEGSCLQSGTPASLFASLSAFYLMWPKPTVTKNNKVKFYDPPGIRYQFIKETRISLHPRAMWLFFDIFLSVVNLCGLLIVKIS